MLEAGELQTRVPVLTNRAIFPQQESRPAFPVTLGAWLLPGADGMTHLDSLRRLDEFEFARKPGDDRQRRKHDGCLHQDNDHGQEDLDEEVRDRAFHAVDHAGDPREGVEEGSCR